MTEEVAVQNALAHNAEFKARLESIGVAQGQVLQAKKPPNPTLDLSRSTDKLFENRGEGSYGVGVTQEFETWGKRKYRVKAAQANLEKIKADVDNFERLLIYQVRQAYFETLRAEKQKKLADEMTGLTDHVVQLDEQRVKAGDIPEVELNLAKVELGRARQASRSAENQARNARLRLNYLMGESIYNDFTVVSDFSSSRPTDKTVDQLIAFALEHRPDLASSGRARDVAAQNTNLARANAKPNVSVGVEYSHDRTVFEEDSFLPRGLLDSIDETGNSMRFSFSVPLPIFNRNQGNIASAAADQRASENLFAFTQETVRQEVASSYNNWISAMRLRELYEKGILPQLKDNLNSIQSAYELGGQSILAVIEQQRTYQQVNSQYLDTLFEMQTALDQLEAALGGRLSDVK
ncbi:MAG: TolC family protein [Acidobacteriia bacterium]|nr:TolC family protein [Terriglobia bacterium]